AQHFQGLFVGCRVGSAQVNPGQRPLDRLLLAPLLLGVLSLVVHPFGRDSLCAALRLPLLLADVPSLIYHGVRTFRVQLIRSFHRAVPYFMPLRHVVSSLPFVFYWRRRSAVYIVGLIHSA